jgi:hypothetical protein
MTKRKAEASEATEPKHSGLIPYKPGQSGNPAGRPKGSRNKLGEDFLRALHDNFQEHGVATIETVRTERPHEYLKVVASLLPKQIEVKEGAFDGIGDEELAALVAAARSALGVSDEGRGGVEVTLQ